MSNDPNKMNFDPIPVSAASRPELPKVPDLPVPKATAKSPPAPVEAPAAVLAPPSSFSVWSILEPSRTKGVIAAGIVSLIGGATTMNYIWPPKSPAPVAQREPDATAPLPPLNPSPKVESIATVPPVVPVPTVPVVPMTVATVPPVTSIPAISLPPLTELPATKSSPGLATSPAPIPVPTISSGTSIALPAVIPTGGSEPTSPPVPAPKPADKSGEIALPSISISGGPTPAEKPIDITLPSITSAGGTAPAIPSAIALPAPGTASPTSPVGTPPALTTPMTTPPALLTVPEVKIDPTSPLPLPKVEVAKENRNDPPPLTSVPVVGAPSPAIKPIAIGVPAPGVETALPVPKLEFGTKLPDVKPVAAPELPAVSALPAVAKPQPVATNATTEYDVDLHYVKAGDSWAAISKLHFGDERYADALKGYNQNSALAQIQRAEIPPVHVLRKNFASLIGRPVEKAEWGTITPSSATLTSNEPKRSSVTGNGYKIYSVPAGGRTLKEIAADAYGDEGRWGMVWDTNPKLVPDKSVPEGTKIYLTSQSKIGD